MRIAVLGAGSWGTALAAVLGADSDCSVTLWARDARLADVLAADRHNPRYLTSVPLPADVRVTVGTDAVLDAAVVILAVPTQGMRDVVSAFAPSLPRDAVLVSAAKGFEPGSAATMCAVIGDVLGGESDARVVALSGPNIAVEIANGLPAATVVGGGDEAAARVRDLCSRRMFRVYSTDDRTGVEYGGALKNVIAIAVGACDGIGAGDNGKAAIMTRGIAEMTRLGVSAGAAPLTFAGLAGLGDCVVTCMSPHSRNRQLGEAMARGANLEQALAQVRMVVEGVSATRAATQLAGEHNVDMPITREVHALLFEGKPPAEALADLMRRDPAPELHGLGGGDGLDSEATSGSSSGG